MLKINECLRVRGEIVAFDHISEDEVIYAMRHKSIRSFHIHSCQTAISFMTEQLTSTTTAVDFHKALQLIAIANEKTISIFNLKTQLLLQTIISYNGEISTIHFVQNSPYLIVGTKQGRVMQYRYDAKISIARLYSFSYNNLTQRRIDNIYKNDVNAIDSYGDLVASSGYAGSIILIKLH